MESDCIAHYKFLELPRGRRRTSDLYSPFRTSGIAKCLLVKILQGFGNLIPKLSLFLIPTRNTLATSKFPGKNVWLLPDDRSVFFFCDLGDFKWFRTYFLIDLYIFFVFWNFHMSFIHSNCIKLLGTCVAGWILDRTCFMIDLHFIHSNCIKLLGTCCWFNSWRNVFYNWFSFIHLNCIKVLGTRCWLNSWPNVFYNWFAFHTLELHKVIWYPLLVE